MLNRIQVVLALFCMATYASAGTTVLGTASVHGNMRVDGYTVKGDATVFDGSVVETEDASANLRMGHGVEISLSKDSRGKIYRDHFVLQRGKSEMTSTGPFRMEANGLNVTPDAPNSTGIVTLTTENAVEVSTLAGSFQVRDDQGALVSYVIPGRPFSFAVPAQASTSPSSVSTVGLLDSDNGHFFITTDENVKYELTGANLQQFVGDKVVVTGTLDPAAQAGGTAGTITVKTIEINPGGPRAGMTKAGKRMVIATALGGAGAVAWVIYDAEQPTPSR